MWLKKDLIYAAGFREDAGDASQESGWPTAARNWPRQPAHEEMGAQS